MDEEQVYVKSVMVQPGPDELGGARSSTDVKGEIKDEEWRDIPTSLGPIPGYQVSNYGRVRNVQRMGNARGGMLAGRMSQGKARVQIRSVETGDPTDYFVHNLVWCVFENGGKRLPQGTIIVHQNHRRNDARLSNLRYYQREESRAGVWIEKNESVITGPIDEKGEGDLW